MHNDMFNNFSILKFFWYQDEA